MIKLLMKYLLFAGVMAVVVGCTEEKNGGSLYRTT